MMKKISVGEHLSILLLGGKINQQNVKNSMEVPKIFRTRTSYDPKSHSWVYSQSIYQEHVEEKTVFYVYCSTSIIDNSQNIVGACFPPQIVVETNLPMQQNLEVSSLGDYQAIRKDIASRNGAGVRIKDLKDRSFLILAFTFTMW